MACYGKLLGRKAFWEVLQGGGQPVLPVFGKVTDISQKTVGEMSSGQREGLL